MDREDWLYLGGVAACVVGCALIHLPYGLLCLGGSLVAWPFVARLLAGRPKQ